MSARVQILSSDLANQIAAGEVVERPASVVKELIENALDAGGRRIRIDIEQGGVTLVRVSDDGIGMDREDARLAVLRHATSKLTAIDDLLRQGDALPDETRVLYVSPLKALGNDIQKNLAAPLAELRERDATLQT